MTDDTIVIGYVLSGKTEHFGTLMNKYHNEIFSFVFNMLGNYDDTEDLLQEIFMKTYNKLKTYNSEKSSFRTWLYRIASNHTINYLKSSAYRKHSNSEVETSLLVGEENIEEEFIKDRQISEIVKIMKRKLSVKHQKILILHYFSGLNVKEISETLEIPDKTIYKALKTSIEKIKEEVTTND